MIWSRWSEHGRSMVYLNPSHAHSNGGGSSSKNGVDSHNGHHEVDSPFTSLNNASDASSGEEEREGRIRVGKDYQAMTPPFIPQTRKCISIKKEADCQMLLDLLLRKSLMRHG